MKNIINKSFTISFEEAIKAFNFAYNIVKSQSQSKKDFQRSDIDRHANDHMADTFEGKIAEIAFKKFAEQFGLIIDIDFDIYNDPRHIDYGQDIDAIIIDNQIYRVRSRIDIKATRQYSHWLLVETRKFWADAYILCKVHLPSNIEKDIEQLKSAITKDIDTTIEGFAYHFDLIDTNTKMPWFHFKRNYINNIPFFNPNKIKAKKEYSNPNDVINHIKKMTEYKQLKEINIELKADENYGYPIKWLRNSYDEWNDIILWIRNSAFKEK